MNEDQLKRAFADALAAGSPPLALDAAGMVHKARHQRRLRQARLAAGTSALAAVSIAGAAALVPLLGGGTGGSSSAGSPSCDGPSAVAVSDSGPVVEKLPSGGTQTLPPPVATTGPTTTGPTATGPTATEPPRTTGQPPCPGDGSDTERPWPSGQQDRTAHTGPHAERAARVRAALEGRVPAGFQSTARWNQGQFEDWDADREVWSYEAGLAVTKSGRTGFLLAQVVTADRGAPTDLCTLAATFYGPPATGCQVISVDGKRVAIARHPDEQRNQGYSPDLDQWAVYRYPDGMVVRVAEAKSVGEGQPLTAPLFTEQQLARLATSSQLAG